MKCPVCEERIQTTTRKCPNCNFADLRTEFINENELEMWRTYVVYPCRFAYQAAVAQRKELEERFQNQLAEIMRVYKDQRTAENTLISTPPSFEEIAMKKNDERLTEGNISYKRSYVCAYTYQASCEVSNLSFDFSENEIIVVSFSVKKTFDYKGDKEHGIIAINWKLKDEHGLVIEDGCWMHHGLMRVGTVGLGSISIKTLNLKPSAKYVLELTDFTSVNSRIKEDI